MKNKEFNKIKPYTYLLTRKKDNKKYYGVRWGNIKAPIEDIGKIYFTSSNIIKLDFKKNPENYIIKLCWTFDDINEARDYEVKILKKVFKKNNWINKNAFPAIFNEKPTMLGKSHSADTKIKMSQWQKLNHPMKGKIHKPESKLKISESLKGKKHSKESKIKMSTNRKGKYKGKDHKMYGKKLNKDHPFVLFSKARKGTPLKEETKEKISKSSTGKIISFETRKKISNSSKGFKNPMYGKKHSPETIEKIKLKSKARWTFEARRLLSGINHHNFGKKWSEEHKRKIGFSVTGNKNGMFGKKHSEITKETIKNKALERSKKKYA